MKADKLFVFRPCTYWTSVGGCVIIAARTFDDVLTLVGQHNEVEFKKDAARDAARVEYGTNSDEYLCLPDGDPFHEKFMLYDDRDAKISWVLDKTYDLKRPVEAGIEFINYHWFEY